MCILWCLDENMEDLLDIPGERFEFETRMLIESEGKAPT